MEPLGAFPNGEWDCFLSSLLLGEDHELNIGTQSTFCSASEPGETEHMFYSLDAHNSNSHYISQESNYTDNFGGDAVFIANPSHTNYYFSYPDHVLANNTYVSMDENLFATFVPSVTDIVMEENIATLNEDEGSDRLVNSDHHSQMEPIVFPTKHLQLKRKLDVPDKINNRSENQKKKPRVSKDGQGCMKNARSKKNQKLLSNIEGEAEETNTVSDGQVSSSNISEDDNASQEISGATSRSKSALNSNGKTRASKGSATDPQSLYARKRREKINERLRILQNLVPNGTKVDISTMLEDAVNYVKFLQLQIKLLSSDDLWMYAPLAYSGLLDIGLNLNLKNCSPQ